MNHPVLHPDTARRRARRNLWRFISALAVVVGIVVGIGTIFKWWIVRDPGRPTSTIEVKVRKAGNRSWHDVEGARPGALLEYRVTAGNPGGIDLNHLEVSLAAPDGVRLLPGACTLRVDSGASRCPAKWIERGFSQPRLRASTTVTAIVSGVLSRRVDDRLLPLRGVANSDETEPVGDIAEVKPRATHDEAAARSLVRAAGGEETLEWRGRPELAERSERLLARRWRRLNPERLRDLATVPAGQHVSVERLAHDRRLDGQVVTVVGEIEEEPITYPGYRSRVSGGTEADGPRLTKQTFLLAGERQAAVASCAATREAGRRLHRGDLVRIRAVPLAWGRATLGDATVAAVALACVATRRPPEADEDAPSEPRPPPRTIERCELRSPG